MLHHFFGRAGKAPDEVTSQDVFAWAYGTGVSGKQPSSITIGARIACLSSFYRFLIRMKVVSSNPSDALERPKVTAGAARGLSGEQIHRLPDVVPATPVGLRDRAIILALVFTGRRRAEVFGMTAGSISVENATVFYSYRGKGGKAGKRELPRPACEATCTWLECVGKAGIGHQRTLAMGRRRLGPGDGFRSGGAEREVGAEPVLERSQAVDLTMLQPDESLWSATRGGRGITSGTFYTNPRCYLKNAGLPSAACTSSGTRRRSCIVTPGSRSKTCPGSSIHSSLAVTTTYLRRLEGQEDRSWSKVAEGRSGSSLSRRPASGFTSSELAEATTATARCSRSQAATFCLVATLSGPRFWRQTQVRS